MPNVRHPFTTTGYSHFGNVPALGENHRATEVVIIDEAIVKASTIVGPIVRHPTIGVDTNLVHVILVPNHMRPDTMATSTPVQFVARAVALDVAILVNMTYRRTGVPTVLHITAPLHRVTT